MLGEGFRRTSQARPPYRRPSTSSRPNLDAYLKLLRRDGTLVSVGDPSEPLPVAVFSLFGNRRSSFAGSSTGGIAETQEMLDFRAEHGIEPDTELINAAAIKTPGTESSAPTFRPMPIPVLDRRPWRERAAP